MGGWEWVTPTVMNPQTLALVIEHFGVWEGADSFLVTYLPLPILAPGFGGVRSGSLKELLDPKSSLKFSPRKVQSCT